ncbi:MAG: flagellar basal body-associated FliL family protein [Rhodobacteraceae bacterium]|nr:flagellar basal body-associated FliL family protein [Paracoccaceae bacterium]MCC5961861.1 flagellar basal body-associated FliL family protein [Paracoccaceae bacterium]TVR49634.1 MAG: flagellar basal body-associated protein FliL [Paracoccaceae bacterium]
MGKLIALVLVVLGVGAGLGAGLYLRPVPEVDAAEPPPESPQSEITLGSYEFDSQFVVPLVTDDQVAQLVVIKLALEIDDATREAVHASAARLRDSFLQVLFDHANNGGFQGAFTTQDNLSRLRRALREAAQHRLGAGVVQDVLITDILRTNA